MAMNTDGIPPNIAEPMVDTALSPWDILNDDDLATLYAEAAEKAHAPDF
jgi:hypothetical protein